MQDKKKPTIEELEAILAYPTPQRIVTQGDGSIRAVQSLIVAQALYPYRSGPCQVCGDDVFYETKIEAEAPGPDIHEDCDNEQWAKAEQEMTAKMKADFATQGGNSHPGKKPKQEGEETCMECENHFPPAQLKSYFGNLICAVCMIEVRAEERAEAKSHDPAHFSGKAFHLEGTSEGSHRILAGHDEEAPLVCFTKDLDAGIQQAQDLASKGYAAVLGYPLGKGVFMVDERTMAAWVNTLHANCQDLQNPSIGRFDIAGQLWELLHELPGGEGLSTTPLLVRKHAREGAFKASATLRRDLMDARRLAGGIEGNVQAEALFDKLSEALDTLTALQTLLREGGSDV